MNLGEETEKRLEEAAAKHGRKLRFEQASRQALNAGNAIAIEPSVVLQRIEATALYRVIVSVTGVREASNNLDAWRERVLVVMPDARPLQGEGGWIDGNESRFKSSVLAALPVAVDYLAFEMVKGVPRSSFKQGEVALQRADEMVTRRSSAGVIEEFNGRTVVIPVTDGQPRGTYLVPPGSVMIGKLRSIEEIAASVPKPRQR